MLKKVIKLVVCFSFIFTIFPKKLNAKEYDQYEEFIRAFVYTMDDEIVETNKIKTLKDIRNNESFYLYRINESGYCVIAKENLNISELLVSSHFDDSYFTNKEYYVGQGVFYTEDEYNELLKTKQLKIREAADDLTEIVNIQNKITQENLNIEYVEKKKTRASVVIGKPSEISGANEYGISDGRMVEYTKDEWKNSTLYGYDYQYAGEGICGSISTAIALSYLDRYINSNVIINSPYSFSQPKFAEWLIIKLRDQIEPPLPGSFASDIVDGIKWWYNTNWSGLSSSGTTLIPRYTYDDSIYKSNISNGYPVILYITGSAAQGNPYSVHWVTGYRYSSLNNATWFKVADNWGNLAWVNRTWISNSVYFR